MLQRGVDIDHDYTMCSLKLPVAKQRGRGAKRSRMYIAEAGSECISGRYRPFVGGDNNLSRCV